MQPEYFKGTNYLYNFWNDMNEPSVFRNPVNRMPLNNLYYKSDGTAVMHKDLHNLYGALQLRTSYYGMLRRDPDLRPFVLTRSYFFGSQKYGAFWTGDNQ